MTFKNNFKDFKVGIFLMKIYIVVTDVVSDIRYSYKSVTTCVVKTLFSYDMSYDKCICTLLSVCLS